MFWVRSFTSPMVIWAFGAFANTALASVQCAELTHTQTYLAVEKLLNEADEAMRKMNNERALALLDAGIAQLAPYYPPCPANGACTDDDTGQKLSLGNSHQTEGRLWFAANLKSGVLANRLEMYRIHNSCR